MKCNHNKYREGYLVATEALKAMRSRISGICWMGMIVRECEDCGEDLSRHKIVQVKTAAEIVEERLI